MKPTRKSTLIESDEFPFEFLSHLAERESWRKQEVVPRKKLSRNGKTR